MFVSQKLEGWNPDFLFSFMALGRIFTEIFNFLVRIFFLSHILSCKIPSSFLDGLKLSGSQWQQHNPTKDP